MEIALFGAGFAGKRYLKALNYFYQCSKKEIVVYLYDTKQEALDSISDDYAFRIVKNLFEEDKPFYLPNHIIIAVNEYSHYYLILKIIKQAKSALKILVEKPFVENLNQLKDLMQYPNFTKHSWSLALVERFSPITQIAKVFVSKYLTNDNIRIEFFWGKDRSYDKRPTMGVLSEIIHPLDLCYYIFDFVPIDCYSNISYANYSIENKIKPAGIDVILKNSHKLAIGHASFLWPERNRQIFAFILKKKKKFLLNLKILCGGYHNLNSIVASFFNISGPRYTVATACSSSLLALKIANLKLQQDENLEAAIVYGVDAFSEMVFHVFLSLGAMSDDFCKPFYRMEGMNLGEAGVAVVLTKNKNFKSNYGYLKNVALNCDAYHITASNPEGLGGAKLFTLLGKELSQKIDIIIAHGSGTQSNDMSEYTAIQKWKNLSGQDPLILATKGATGHTLGAADLLNFALGSLIIKNDIVPKMPNITAYKESFFQDFNLSVVNKKQKVNNIFVNAFGFGGNNSVALLCKHNITNSTNFVQFSPKIISAVGLICRFGCNIDDFIQAVLSDSLTFYSKKNCSFSKKKCSLQDFRISDENYKEMRIGLKDYEFIKRLDRASTCLLSAISQIEPSLKNKQALGIVFGTGTGPSSSFFNYYDQLVKSNFKRANSIVFPNTVSNTPVSYSSMKLKCKGPSILLCDGAVSSSNAFEVAGLLLSNNDCPHVICGSFDEYSETLEKAYLDIGLVKSGHSHIGCNLGELYATFALSNFTKQEQVGFGIYNGSLYSEHATPGPHRYSKDYKYILEVIESALKKFGNPDLVIYNKKNKQEHDALLQNTIEAVLKGCICYSPTEQFGYLLGGHTSLAAIIAISCFRSNEFSYKLLKTNKKIHNVFVLTLNDGGMFKIDNFVDHVQ